MSDFPMKKPTLVLHTKEDTLYALAHTSDWLTTPSGAGNPDSWTVKSVWLIELIDRIIAETGKDIAYNAEIKALAHKELYGVELTHEQAAKEGGDALSRLIYNAQNYRRSDMLEAAGFVPCTQALIEQAGVGGQLQRPTSSLFTIIVNGVKVDDTPDTYTVRDHKGTLHAFKPRKRNSCLSTNGQPVKIVKYGKKRQPQPA